MSFVLIAVVLAVGLALSAFVAMKIRKVHVKLFEIDKRAEERLATHFMQVEALLGLTRELNLANGLQSTRGWAGSPDFLLQVLRMAMHRKPQTVAECSSGVSTVVLARAMQMLGSGHVWSLEHEPVFAEKTRAELRRHGLQDWATVVDAPLQPTATREGNWSWYTVSGLPDAKIDLLVIDGPPMTLQKLSRFPAIPVLDSKLSADAVVMLDDAARPDETEAVRQWVGIYGWRDAGPFYAEKGISVLTRSSTSR